jgi:DNA polymerase-4
MNRLGIFTGADLRQRTLEYLVRHFGKSASWYYAIARGEDDRAVAPDRPRKSSGSETTFSTDLTEPAAIEAEVQAMADEVWGWSEKTRMFGRTVTVKIRYADFRQITRSRTGVRPVQSREALRAISIDLARSVLPPAIGIRLLGVTVSGFDNRDRHPTAQLGFDL